MSHERSYDIVVVGAGPAGLAAAWEASRSGARVAVLESSPWLGGQIWKDTNEHPVQGQGRRWIKRVQAASFALHLETTVVAAPESHMLLVESKEGGGTIQYEKLVLATGARECFVPFPGWTLPRVVGAGGLQALVKSGWPVRDRRVVVAGSGPLMLAVTAELRKQGAKVKAIVEQASWRSMLDFGRIMTGHLGKLLQGAGLGRHLIGIPYHWGWWPVEAQGRKAVERVVISSGKVTRTLDCDLLACAFGLVPNLELPRLLNVECVNGRVGVDEEQRTNCDTVYAAGELTGIAGVDGALVEGRIAGLCAVGQGQQAERFTAQRRRWQGFEAQLTRAFGLREELKHLATDDTVICRCEDVTLGQLKQYTDLRSAKLQCRCGMGHCQGRVCGDTLHQLFGWEANRVREPLVPVRLKTLCNGSQLALASNESRSCFC